MRHRDSEREHLVSKGLSYGEKELEVADILNDARIGRAGGRGAGIDAGEEQLVLGSLEAIEVRGIDGIAEVDAERADGGAITDAEADGVDHVIEVLHTVLAGAESDVVEGGIDVTHVVIEDAADVVADQGEAQLVLVEEQGVAAERKTGGHIAGAGLVFGETTVGVAAAAEEALGEGDGVDWIAEVVEGSDIADFSAAGEDQALADGVVRGVAEEHVDEVALRAEKVFGEADIDGSVETLVGIDGIVAAVLHQVDGSDADANGLGELRDEKGSDFEIGDGDAAVCQAIEKGGGFGEPLGELGGAFLAGEIEGADIARVFEQAGEGDVEVVGALKVRPRIVEEDALIEGGNASAQADAVADAPEVVAGDIERDARREAGGAGGSIQAIVAGADAAELGANADSQRIAAGFLQLGEDVLVVGRAIGGLNGGVDAGEDAQVVEAALGFRDFGGRERIPGVECQVAIDQAGTGVGEGVGEHLADELLLAFVDHVVQVKAVGIGGGLVAPFEGGVGKALVKVLRQDGIAVDGDAEFTEGLAGDRAEAGEDGGAVEVVDAIHLELVYEGLGAFVDGERDGQRAGLALIIVLAARGDGGFAEAIGLIEIDDGLDIAAEQAGAVAAVRELEQRSGLEVHALADGVEAKIAVAGDDDGDQLVARAGVDKVVDGGAIVDDALLFEHHLGFEIAFGLEKILEVVGAFNQQVAIHGVLFEDRHVALHFPLRNLGADGMDFDARAGLNAQSGLRRVGRGIVLHAFERDLGLQTIVFLIEGADAFQGLLDAGLRHGLPGVDDPAAEFGGGEDAFGVELEIAEEQRGGEAGAGAARDIEADVDLLR